LKTKKEGELRTPLRSEGAEKKRRAGDNPFPEGKESGKEGARTLIHKTCEKKRRKESNPAARIFYDHPRERAEEERKSP